MPATILTGIVTKAGAMAKTVTMTVKKVKTHPKLLKTYMRHKKYLVHDENSELQIGERIRAQACRPLSARKRFTLLERIGYNHMPTEHDEHGTIADELRRRKADAAMSAEQKERLRIEKRVKDELHSRS
ncbi:hypothetical protein MYAM1_000575 [Malassezia yamatoensis]|uniref:30S ribosomal protein S17 n=1 Tax=Malassezia yamatoensis TaxID=253288 RepID=A0AAJ5YWS8_9BASI|nr:hypothetical protein MYAM1_000575 [Malassezia yamatoensis]